MVRPFGAETARERSRGGFETKVHLLTNELGLPLGFVSTAGSDNMSTQPGRRMPASATPEFCGTLMASCIQRRMAQTAGPSRSAAHPPSSFAKSTPPGWFASRERAGFQQKLKRASLPLLLCDYDGTLAPFQTDKMQAYPFPGVAERLERIAESGTQLAFLTGRPSCELIMLLPIAAKAEIWGMHGREHLPVGGSSQLFVPSHTQREALDQAERRLSEAGLASLLERKIGSIALHWRTLDWPETSPKSLQGDSMATEQLPMTVREAQQRAEEVFTPLAGNHDLALLPFDGGLELRAADRTKGHAAESVLTSTGADVAAFLGDDTTDEDAFETLRVHGHLGLLVREPARASYASFALRPPAQLLCFLDEWLAARPSSGG